MNNLKLWLAYVSYPVTTAVYFERALRRLCLTTTIGPRLPGELLELWKLENMKLPILDQDIPTDFTPDMQVLLAATPPEEQPDLYLWIESVPGHFPRNLAALPCPRACYLIDSHLSLEWHLQWAAQFDVTFIAQREYLPQFHARGLNAHWLPLACDPEIHRNWGPEKSYDIGFVGSQVLNPRRTNLLQQLQTHLPVHVERCFWEDMARVFSASRLVFNNAVRNDLNMRFFEVMSTGSLLLSDRTSNSCQEELFVAGEDYAAYRDADIREVASFYLENEGLREQIALRGQMLVHNAHTYEHRVRDLLNVAAGGKESTFSAAELRQRSLTGIPEPYAQLKTQALCLSSARRSFVIPVLDHSPASEYSITTLLADLADIDGEVIVIFNSTEVAEELKDHPRIDRYAILKQNVGVARAWNLGMTIAATPTVFILNADLHLQREAVDTLEKLLWELPDAVCVGPQGSFVDFALTRDYVYFDKGMCRTPLPVDAVSGFFFAVKLERFSDQTLRFEDGFTPCYFEEWDLGLQIRKAGLKSYVVPTTAYAHHWSGSIRALREIAFYEKSETAGDILLRNRQLFLTKWRTIARLENCSHLLESLYRNYALVQVQRLIEESYFPDANSLLTSLQNAFPEDGEITALKRFTDYQMLKLRTSVS